jgi:hypothetical protein
MKINEINQPAQIDEGIGSALIGDRAAAAVRGFFSGKGTKHTQYQQAFLKDFYQDAITSLDNGIRGGFVDPNLASDATPGGTTSDGTVTSSSKPGATPAPSAPSATTAAPSATTAAPSATSAAPTKPGAAAATATKAQQQTNQALNNYIKQAAQTINSTTDKNQKIALTKELVNAMADRKGYPEWENALATVQKVVKSGNVDPNFANAAINKLKAGATMTEAWRIYFANKLVEAVGLTWKDLGLSVLKEGKNYYIAETNYVKLNQLFESIMEVTTGGAGFGAAPGGATATIGRAGSTPAPQNINPPKNATLATPTVPQANAKQQSQSNGVSIGKYMTDWFASYMNNTKWESYKAQVEPMIQAIEDSYARDKGKAVIKQLAKTAFSISKLSPTKPQGAPEPPKDGEKNPDNAAPDPFGNLFKGNNAELEQQLAALKKNNPEGYEAAVAKLGTK